MDHGSHAAYKSGCRCTICRRFRADYVRAQRARSGNPEGRARNRATAEAARRYRAEHPAAWDALLDEARAALGLRARP